MTGSHAWRYAVGAIGCLVLLIVAYVAFQVRTPEITQTSELAATRSSAFPASAPGAESGSKSASAVRPERRGSRPSVAEYDSAGTEEDVAWLVRNGYPTRRMTEAAVARGGLGATLRFSGTPDAEAILDAEQIALSDPSRRGEAIQTLSRHAQAGSVYALETLAKVYQDGASPDPIRARAFMKAAEMRGNWAAGTAPLQHELSRQQEMYATVMAHQVIRSLSRHRERMRLPPLSIDTRPGLDQLVMEIDELHRVAGN